ncbi:hypothetical protein GVN16_09360 [Emticicia sp. CRIBPO]|uniref:acyl-CoA thioester hydrolase/BAAT C-terminal domain-containing protein n=1 Tax=Emticicia sp. CRIBPO TaxID=2683258 RepID=UPI0014132812|nr:acyl-CoA thioester hydrolase/BAAT C-terminal domain-containing protein [Emticicia sp. CRIBPO]NBA85967.1 hypothetical protein [Emticicia sp. CRIBPO]
MKQCLVLILFLKIVVASGQQKQPGDFGFRHFRTLYNNDPVDILVLSEKGKESEKKPLFFFCQGSLPVPLIKPDGDKLYSVFPFNTDALSKDFHIVIVSKPFIPVVVEAGKLVRGFNYVDPETGKTPKGYGERNLPGYYVGRNLEIVRFLQQQPFVSPEKLVVAGHSEGSTVAVRMAAASKKVSHLIYAGGCPAGRILSMTGRSRSVETDSSSSTEDEFNYWESVVNDPDNMDDSNGDTNKATFDFSAPLYPLFENLSIPVLVSFGTKDYCAPFNDYLRVEMIRHKKANFTFNAYIGFEHNFFPLKPDGKPDYDIFNWDKVASDWKNWLDKK